MNLLKEYYYRIVRKVFFISEFIFAGLVFLLYIGITIGSFGKYGGILYFWVASLILFGNTYLSIRKKRVIGVREILLNIFLMLIINGFIFMISIKG